MRLRVLTPRGMDLRWFAQVWQRGVAKLRDAIASDTDFVLETTLGDKSITNLIAAADAALRGG
jgi:predicted ABC-type ATPase